MKRNKSSPFRGLKMASTVALGVLLAALSIGAFFFALGSTTQTANAAELPSLSLSDTTHSGPSDGLVAPAQSDHGLQMDYSITTNITDNGGITGHTDGAVIADPGPNDGATVDQQTTADNVNDGSPLTVPRTPVTIAGLSIIALTALLWTAGRRSSAYATSLGVNGDGFFKRTTTSTRDGPLAQTTRWAANLATKCGQALGITDRPRSQLRHEELDRSTTSTDILPTMTDQLGKHGRQ